MKVQAEALRVIPYLKHPGDERFINLTSYWDGEAWHAWLPHDGGLIKIQGGEVVEGGYFGITPEREDDLYFEFLDFMWKRASWQELSKWVFAVEGHIQRIATSLAKIEHFNQAFREHTDSERLHVGRFIETELEYLFGRCRSMFDDLQQIAAALWARVQLHNETEQKRKRPLPADSFRVAHQRIEKAKSETGAGSPYGLPEPIVLAYDKVSKFFYSMRAIRDGIMHGGKGAATVFTVDGENAILKSDRFARMTPFKPEDERNTNLVSLSPAIANLVFSTLHAFNDFIAAFKSVLEFPGSMMPNHRYFLRSPHMAALAAAHKAFTRTNSTEPTT